MSILLLIGLGTNVSAQTYIDGSYQIIKQKVGGSYGTFPGTGVRIGLGKKFGILGLEAYYAQNKANDTKVFHGQPYSIDVEETFIGASGRFFLLTYLSIQFGYAKHDRMIVVPPGCPFQDEFVLDDTCYGPILGAGVNLPLGKRAELHGGYILDKGCNQKETVELGLRIYL